MYEQHNPTKVAGEEGKTFIASLLTKYKGREQALLDAVTEKYAKKYVVHVMRLGPTVYAIIYKYKPSLADHELGIHWGWRTLKYHLGRDKVTVAIVETFRGPCIAQGMGEQARDQTH